MVDILIGLCLIIIGFIWYKYESDDIRKRKKRGDDFIWSGKPKMFLGIFTILAIGLSMIIKALK